jgi:hypothetical protein
MLYARAEQLDGVPCPIDILEMSKAQFLVEPPKGKEFDEGLREFYAALHANIDKLKKAVGAVVAANATLNTVSAWETRAADAAALSVNEVYRCARSDEPDPSKVTESFTKVAAKIAVAAAGSTAAQADPARALDTGMQDILIDQFGVSVEAPEYKQAVSTALGPTIAGEIVFTDSVAMNGELNTFFHVDREVRNAKSWDRGVVIPASPPLDGNALGFNPGELLVAEFLFPVDQVQRAKQTDALNHLRQLQQNPRIVLIEMGADCDHAQDQDRTRRFLVALELPQELLYLASLSKGRKLKNGSLELLGPWKLNGTVMYLIVSCRRYWTWQASTPPPGAPMYRLRAALVDKLLHRYSAWSSRPGIVEFR